MMIIASEASKPLTACAEVKAPNASAGQKAEARCQDTDHGLTIVSWNPAAGGGRAGGCC